MTILSKVPGNHVRRAKLRAARLDEKVYKLGVKALRLLDKDPAGGTRLLEEVKRLQSKRDELLEFIGVVD